MSNKQNVRVRFAPSPTGDPHFGTLRTALFNFLYARNTGGSFILRIEDTDKSREVEGSEQRMTEALEWLGIKPDEGPGMGGDKGPYKQSERLELYRTHAAQLIESGHAYYCFCTSERLEQVRHDQEAKKQPPRYDRHCRNLSEDEVKSRLDKGEPFVIRLKVPDHQEIAWDDLIKGTISFQSDEIDDQVLLKSDGFPTYHLANVVDDHLMEISHAIRGEDWLSSTPKHLLLYKAFGWEAPHFAHMPLIFGPDKTKLSKRHGDTSILTYKEQKGYVPQAITHFMAFLGWTPDHVKDHYRMEDLTRDFSLDRVQKSPAIFDQAKLDSLGQAYMAHLSLTEGFAQFKAWLKLHGEGSEQYQKLLDHEPEAAMMMFDVVRNRSAYFAQAVEALKAFFNDAALTKLSAGDLTLDGKIENAAARKAIEVIHEGLEKFDSQTLKPTAIERITQLQDYFRGLQPAEMNGQTYLHPTRVAITGERQSMNMFEYLAAYLLTSDGKAAVLKRLERAKGLLT